MDENSALYRLLTHMIRNGTKNEIARGTDGGNESRSLSLPISGGGSKSGGGPRESMDERAVIMLRLVRESCSTSWGDSGGASSGGVLETMSIGKSSVTMLPLPGKTILRQALYYVEVN